MHPLLFIGLVLLLIGGVILLRFLKLSRKGIEVEGVVFDIVNSDSSNSYSQYPVIRFLTKKDEWITHTYNVSVFPGLYKKGAKVQVIYNAEKPTDFFVKMRYGLTIPIVLLILSMIFIGFGIFGLPGI